MLGNWVPPPGPGRVLVTNSAVSSVGNGLYLAGSAIYYVRILGVSPTTVGLALTLGGLLALGTSVPLGRWCDRVGPRRAAMVMAACKAALLVMASLVTQPAMVVATVTALAVVEAGGGTARGALISAVMGREGRVALSAKLRSVFNAGFSLGVLGAGLALAVDTRIAYQSLFWFNAAAMIFICLGYLRIPRCHSNAGESAPPRLFDWPYLAVAQISGMARVGALALAVGLPVWLVEQTSAPRPLAAWLILINTIIVVFFQVAASKGADTVVGAARLQRRAFAALVLACAVTAVSGAVAEQFAVALLVVAVVIFSCAEIWGEGGRWGLRYELAPDHAQGAYGGLFSTGEALAVAGGPLLVTALPEHLGSLGWLLIGAFFVVGLVLNRAVVDWAVRTRPHAFAVRQDLSV